MGVAKGGLKSSSTSPLPGFLHQNLTIATHGTEDVLHFKFPPSASRLAAHLAILSHTPRTPSPPSAPSELKRTTVPGSSVYHSNTRNGTCPDAPPSASPAHPTPPPQPSPGSRKKKKLTTVPGLSAYHSNTRKGRFPSLAFAPNARLAISSHASAPSLVLSTCCHAKRRARGFTSLHQPPNGTGSSEPPQAWWVTSSSTSPLSLVPPLPVLPRFFLKSAGSPGPLRSAGFGPAGKGRTRMPRHESTRASS
jgi:hypothetical protein